MPTLIKCLIIVAVFQQKGPRELVASARQGRGSDVSNLATLARAAATEHRTSLRTRVLMPVTLAGAKLAGPSTNTTRIGHCWEVCIFNAIFTNGTMSHIAGVVIPVNSHVYWNTT